MVISVRTIPSLPHIGTHYATDNPIGQYLAADFIFVRGGPGAGGGFSDALFGLAETGDLLLQFLPTFEQAFSFDFLLLI